MAPFVPASFRGRRHAATTITISSSGGSHRPVSPTVIDVPSDSDEVTSRPRGAARLRRPPPPSPSPSPPVGSVRSPVDVIDIVDSSGDEAAAIRPRKAAARRRRASSPQPSPPAVSVRSPVSIVDIAGSSDDDEATSGGPRKAAAAARRPRPPPPPSSPVTAVRSPSLGTGTAGGDDATSGSGPRTSAAAASRRRRRPPSQPSISAVTVRSPSPAAAAPSAGGGDNEATSAARKKKKRYKKWGMVDERGILAAMADISERNHGVLPPTSKLVTELRDKQIMVDRHDVHASLLSRKIYQLKRKFGKVVEQGRKSRRRNCRNKALYEASKKVWPKLHADAERARARDDDAS